jgi:hypothetical protein
LATRVIFQQVGLGIEFYIDAFFILVFHAGPGWNDCIRPWASALKATIVTVACGDLSDLLHRHGWAMRTTIALEKTY